MKKIKSLLLVFLVVTACQTEDSKESNDLKLDTNFEFKEFTNSNIGIEINGSIELNVSDEMIISTFQKFSSTLDLGLSPQSISLIEKDGNNYLRVYSDKNQVSTIALIKGNNGIYKSGTTVCTSSACSEGGGCLPNGQYCTKCIPPGTPPNNPSTGDCKRSTSGGGSIDPPQ